MKVQKEITEGGKTGIMEVVENIEHKTINQYCPSSHESRPVRIAKKIFSVISYIVVEGGKKIFEQKHGIDCEEGASVDAAQMEKRLKKELIKSEKEKQSFFDKLKNNGYK